MKPKNAALWAAFLFHRLAERTEPTRKVGSQPSQSLTRGGRKYAERVRQIPWRGCGAGAKRQAHSERQQQIFSNDISELERAAQSGPFSICLRGSMGEAECNLLPLPKEVYAHHGLEKVFDPIRLNRSQNLVLPHVDALADNRADCLTIRFKRRPNSILKRILEEGTTLKEGELESFFEQAGKEKSWDNRHVFRMDRRPASQGGDQIHITKGNEKWTYRFDGTRSERNKYTLPATNEVKNMVRTIFKLSPDSTVEAKVISASSQEILVEVLF
jgi:hypothetical protein